VTQLLALTLLPIALVALLSLTAKAARAGEVDRAELARDLERTSVELGAVQARLDAGVTAAARAALSAERDRLRARVENLRTVLGRTP